MAAVPTAIGRLSFTTSFQSRFLISFFSSLDSFPLAAFFAIFSSGATVILVSAQLVALDRDV